MSIDRVLVLGAAGDQGLPLLAELERSGFSPTAGVRRADAMAATPFAHVPTVHADIEDEASLVAAMTGQDALAMHLPFEFDRARAAAYGRTIAAAARRAGLKKIVFNTSCVVAGHDLGLTAHDGRRDIEEAIDRSGVAYVIVRPTVFMDNMVRPWSKPSIVRDGIFAYPAAETLKISWISLGDVAAFMVRALEQDQFITERIAVGGPDALTGDEVAETLSRVIGRTVRFRSLDPGEFAAAMSALVTGSRAVAPHSIYDGMARFYAWYNAQPRSPLALDPDAALGKLAIEPTPLAAWAARQDWS